ncbi:MAG: rhomboid family intramembrane serine protease [Bacteroidia bacterium]|nr:rhomboid family intramembrane serine protease [Bacteroidia bacterium]
MQIGLNIVIVIITAIISMLAFNNSNLTNKIIFDPYQIKRSNEFYRFITGGFIHADWIHLAVNMFVLYSFGSIVEQYYNYFFGSSGLLMYGLLYLSSIAAASASSYYKHQNDPGYRALGASGAVSAVLFASVLFQPTQIIRLYGIIPIPGYIGAILYLVYSQYAAKHSRDNIGHEAHFYGAIYGVVFTLMFKPSVFKYFLNQF